MNTIGMNTGFGLLSVLHPLAALAIVIGLVFLLTWAIKTLTVQQLKQWGLGLFIGGVVVCLLTAAAVGFGHGARGYKNSGMMGNQKMMMGGEMGMMNNMGMMLDGLEGDEFDEAFIRMMIPHHEGAIDMAERALESSNREEMKKLARDIIEAQQREIDMMDGWLTTWGFEN